MTTIQSIDKRGITELQAIKLLGLKGRIIRDSKFGTLIKTKDGDFYQLYYVCGTWGVNTNFGKHNPTNWNKIPVKITDTSFQLSYIDLRKQVDIEILKSSQSIYDSATEIVNRLLKYHNIDRKIKFMTFEGQYDTFFDVHSEDGFTREEYYSTLNGAIDILSSGKISEDWQDKKMKYYAEKGNISAMISGNAFMENGVIIKTATCLDKNFKVIVTK